MSGWTWGQATLRLLILAGPLVALFSTALVGSRPAPWLVALTAALSVAFAAMPESPFGSAAMLLVLAWWGISLDDGLHPEAVLAAGGLLISHVAALVASYGPGDLPVDAGVVRTWLGRALLVFVTAPAAWILAAAVRDQPEPPGIWLAGLVASIAAALVASAAFAVRGQD
ncbi:hypothetical protein [Nocardioides sp.]|uniref:hypothetical protein n=1 Tax=Nocardioides sp. TaxID=35761 RepID=UPI0031FE4C46|nr:hypothetical protein [Nocardioides sp.]